MQKIIYNNKLNNFIYPYLDLYTLLSEPNQIETNLKKYYFPYSFQSLIDILNLGLHNNFSYNFLYTESTNKLFFPDKKHIIIAFSGGKDSTALALHYKQLNYNIILYHLHGINKVYPNENRIAKSVAEYLQLPYVEETISLEGTNNYLEHPLKNQIIACFMINYLIEHQLFNYELGYGDFLQDTIKNSKIDRNWSDTIEMWNAFEKSYLNNVGLKLNIIFNTYVDSLKILSQNLQLLNLTQSCLSPYRFLNNLHNINEAKYNIKLFNNRCGSCWKCCVEYIYLSDKNIIPKNHMFYKHCLQVLEKKYHTEKVNTIQQPTIKEIYQAFLYEPPPRYLEEKEMEETNNIKFNDITREFVEDFISKMSPEEKIKLKKYVEDNPRDSSSKTFIVVKSYIYRTYFKKEPTTERKKESFSDVLNSLLSETN